MEREDHPQVRIADVRRDVPVDRADRLQAHQFRQDLGEVGAAQEGLVRQIGERALVDLLHPDHEAAIPVHVRRVEPGDLRLHPGLIAGVLEVAPVIEIDAVEGVEWGRY